MPKKPLELNKLTEILDDITFRPSDEQKRVKAKYWTRHVKLSLGDAPPTLQQVSSIVKDKRIAGWWDEPNFKEWFRNEEEFRERVEYVANLALDVAEQILLNDEARDTARVAVVKLMMELGNKLPNQKAEKFADEDISKMSEAELKAFIKPLLPLLFPDLIKSEPN